VDESELSWGFVAARERERVESLRQAQQDAAAARLEEGTRAIKQLRESITKIPSEKNEKDRLAWKLMTSVIHQSQPGVIPPTEVNTAVPSFPYSRDDSPTPMCNPAPFRPLLNDRKGAALKTSSEANPELTRDLEETGKKYPKLTGDKTPSTSPVKYFHLIVGPVPHETLTKLNRVGVRDMIANQFPDASILIALIPEGRTACFHGAIKLPMRLKKREISRPLYGAFPPSVRVKLSGIAGWDRLCRRIVTEDPNYVSSIREQDAGAFSYRVDRVLLRGRKRTRRSLSSFRKTPK
jgi:hypothetical protein